MKFPPYPSLPVQKEKGYTSLQDEAVKIFNSLQEMETVSDPVPIIQGILQTCQDLKPLRDEVYCQLIKQTNHVPHPNSPANRAHWHLLTSMCCTFLPSRGILRYLKFHLKRCSLFLGSCRDSKTILRLEITKGWNLYLTVFCVFSGLRSCFPVQTLKCLPISSVSL